MILALRLGQQRTEVADGSFDHWRILDSQKQKNGNLLLCMSSMGMFCQPLQKLVVSRG